jgi:hypothetical protein
MSLCSFWAAARSTGTCLRPLQQLLSSVNSTSIGLEGPVLPPDKPQVATNHCALARDKGVDLFRHLRGGSTVTIEAGSLVQSHKKTTVPVTAPSCLHRSPAHSGAANWNQMQHLGLFTIPMVIQSFSKQWACSAPLQPLIS